MTTFDVEDWPEGTAGRVGPHRESHEPRVAALDLLTAGVTPVEGYLEWSDVQPVGEKWGLANNGRWGCCGFSAWQHANMAKLLPDGAWQDAFKTTWLPNFPSLLPAYFAYGLAQGETGTPPDKPDEPDFGVDNASMLAWAYKLGLIYGYAEVPMEYVDWFAQTFHGVLIGQALDGDVAINDFEASPRIPWDTMGKTDGHDTLLAVTHADGTGSEVTWGGVQPYTLAYRQNNWTDAWVIFDKDDPNVDHAALAAALAEVHGTVAPSEADQASPVIDNAERTPAPPKGPEDLAARARGIEADLRHLVEMAARRETEQIIFEAMEKMVAFYLPAL